MITIDDDKDKLFMDRQYLRVTRAFGFSPDLECDRRILHDILNETRLKFQLSIQSLRRWREVNTRLNHPIRVRWSAYQGLAYRKYTRDRWKIYRQACCEYYTINRRWKDPKERMRKKSH